MELSHELHIIEVPNDLNSVLEKMRGCLLLFFGSSKDILSFMSFVYKTKTIGILQINKMYPSWKVYTKWPPKRFTQHELNNEIIIFFSNKQVHSMGTKGV